jgi:hypothetical protein
MKGDKPMKGLFTRHHGAAAGKDEMLRERVAPFSVTDEACCCPARPVVMVILPATATRPFPEDLLLCGHHFRMHESALRAVGAVAYDATGALVTGDPAAGAGQAASPVCLAPADSAAWPR